MNLRACFVLALLVTPTSAYELKKDVVFAKRGERELKLDIAHHGKGKLRPALICIHGGGWINGNRQSQHPIMNYVAEHGYVAATLDYRLSAIAQWPAQMHDVVSGLDWLVKHADEYGIDPERIAVTGQSAGGHLALMMGLAAKEGQRSGIRAIVNVFGPTDLRTIKELEHARGLVEALVGGKLEEKSTARADASPITHLNRTDPPVLTIHGTEDKVVQYFQATRLHKLLEKMKIPNRLVTIEGGGHGLGKQRQRYLELLKEYLDIYTKGPDMPLLARVDFDHGASDWNPTDKNAWEAVQRKGGSFYSLVKQSKYKPKVRSPLNISLLPNVEVGDFVLDVDMKSTNKPYGHQDLCLFFGHQNPSRFYYVHIGRNADPHANSIFLVNDKPRVSIAKERTKGTDWSRGWHRARIVRTAATGKIEVYFDDMKKPVMMAVDKTFQSGRVGVGSFDDTGDFDTIRLWGRNAKK